ncbi:MAG TPA: hydroxymethylglutaryl-CoA reductase, degradative [Anaerolineae bacterium]|nr:hydroxymethylglutaryl-CoA reductase, degradative [Anaerolineae bacterium]
MTESEAESRIPGFYNLSIAQRHADIKERVALSPEAYDALFGERGLSIENADHMVENVVGVFDLPLGIALNFRVNQRDVLIPMVVEEPSVIAGASYMAKLARSGGGFFAETTPPEMIGQIQITGVKEPVVAKEALLREKEHLLSEIDDIDPILNKLGGGARDLEVRILDNPFNEPFLVVHLIYDVRDAMGANAVNTACEHLAPLIQEITGGDVGLRILSNLADRRLANASCTIPVSSLSFGNFSGEEVRDGVISAWAFAAVDPYRAATHNKGIMNGVDPVVIATGNDWRAIEAGAHAYAARSGHYTSLSTWVQDDAGNLVGRLEMPMAVGIVGGATKVHPTAKAALELMKVKTAQELAEIIVSVGLAQNLAALRALATEGIQRGHMSLHARQVAIAAGAQRNEVPRLARQMVQEGVVRIDRAREILQSWR